MAEETSDAETCNIRIASYPPEGGTAFAYRDQKYDFWFYVEIRSHRDNYELVVTRASKKRYGGMIIIEPEDRRLIEDNIRKHFETADLFGRPITASNPAPLVNFAWTLP